MHSETLLLVALVPIVGVLAQWLAWRVRVPAIVFLLVAGILVGPVFGILHPGRVFGDLLDPLVKLCVALILFEGGLSLRWWELKAAGSGVRRLVFPAVPIAWALGSLAAHFVGGLSWPVALLFGAIVVVTGPTVIMPLLRHARLQRRTSSYLKWEGIVNDPIGALLAVFVYEFFTLSAPNGGVSEVLSGILVTLVAGAVLGGGGGWLLGRAFRRGWVPEYLKGGLSVAVALLVFVLADLAQAEAGLAAVTVLGVVLGNLRLQGIEELRRFKESVVVVLVSAVFVVLTADLEPESLEALASPRSILLILAILLLVRPLTVLLATIGSRMERGDKLLVAWIAPRGVVAAAVAAAFAPELVRKGYADANFLVPLVFALVLVTVTLHGLTIGLLARRLGLASTNESGVLVVGANPWSTELAVALNELSVPVLLADSSWSALRRARLAGISVHYGEILSEASEETVDLSQVSRLLAVTGSDAYNALVCGRFAYELGRDRVYQLPLRATNEEDDPRGLANTVRGRTAFGEAAPIEQLLARHYRGWRFMKTKITASFGDEDLRREAGAEAIRLLLVREDGGVAFEVPGDPIAPAAGDRVLTYAPPEPPVAGGDKPGAASGANS